MKSASTLRIFEALVCLFLVGLLGFAWERSQAAEEGPSSRLFVETLEALPATPHDLALSQWLASYPQEVEGRLGLIWVPFEFQILRSEVLLDTDLSAPFHQGRFRRGVAPLKEFEAKLPRGLSHPGFGDPLAPYFFAREVPREPVDSALFAAKSLWLSRVALGEKEPAKELLRDLIQLCRALAHGDQGRFDGRLFWVAQKNLSRFGEAFLLAQRLGLLTSASKSSAEYQARVPDSDWLELLELLSQPLFSPEEVALGEKARLLRALRSQQTWRNTPVVETCEAAVEAYFQDPRSIRTHPDGTRIPCGDELAREFRGMDFERPWWKPTLSWKTQWKQRSDRLSKTRQRETRSSKEIDQARKEWLNKPSPAVSYGQPYGEF